MSSTHLVDGHILILLRNGEEYFPRLIAAIDAATRTVYLETYIYAADNCGRQVSQALQRAATRGVRVHLLLDGFGSADLPDKWVDELRGAGVAVFGIGRKSRASTCAATACAVCTASCAGG